MAFSVSCESHRQSGMTQISKWQQVASNPWSPYKMAAGGLESVVSIQNWSHGGSISATIISNSLFDLLCF